MNLTERLRNWRIERGNIRLGVEKGYTSDDITTLLRVGTWLYSLQAGWKNQEVAKKAGEYIGKSIELAFNKDDEEFEKSKFDWDLASSGLRFRHDGQFGPTPDSSFYAIIRHIQSGIISTRAYERFLRENGMYMVDFECDNPYKGESLDLIIRISNAICERNRKGLEYYGEVLPEFGKPDTRRRPSLQTAIGYAERAIEVSKENLILLTQLDAPIRDWNIAFAENRGNLLEELAERYNGNARKLTEVALFGFLADIETIEQYDRGLALLHRARDLYRAGTSKSVELSVRKSDIKISPEDNEYLFCLENLANFEFKRSKIKKAYDRGIESTYCYKGGHRFRSTWQENQQYRSHLEEAILLFKELYEATKEEGRIPEDLRNRIFGGPSVSGATSAFYDPFMVLGIDRKVGYDEAKKAFRKRALETHPDRHGGDKLKEEEFKKVYRAWQDVQLYCQRN